MNRMKTDKTLPRILDLSVFIRFIRARSLKPLIKHVSEGRWALTSRLDNLVVDEFLKLIGERDAQAFSSSEPPQQLRGSGR